MTTSNQERVQHFHVEVEVPRHSRSLHLRIHIHVHVHVPLHQEDAVHDPAAEEVVLHVPARRPQSWAEVQPDHEVTQALLEMLRDTAVSKNST